MEASNTPWYALDERNRELVICISCLNTNSPGTPFCEHCGTPLTSYAATAPLESIFAEGDFWRKAVAQAKKNPWKQTAILLFLLFMILIILLGMVVPR